MIHIEIQRDSRGIYRSFRCTGHADYAEAGSDIICAGVSALVIHTGNCIQDLNHENPVVHADETNGGYLEMIFRGEPSGQSGYLIDCMIHGLDWIIRQYGTTYLDYVIKEAEKC